MGVVGTQVKVRERSSERLVVSQERSPVQGDDRKDGGAAARAPLTRFHQRIAAESLSSRTGTGASRLAPAMAQSAIDLNPHQVEAAAFALASLATGGAVLADEVGLGKTVEAGLVLAQLAAEGRGRALILVPASLRAQWRAELRDKFGLESEVVDGERVRALEKQGVRTNPFDTGGTRSPRCAPTSSSASPGTSPSSTRRTACGTPTSATTRPARP
jgi:hypothetical protein